MRPIPPQTGPFLKKVEACKLQAYLDSAGVQTIGIGHTGPGIALGLEITQAQADAYLDQDMAQAATLLAGQVSDDVIAALTDSQYAALISFVFNLGANPKWTIWRVLNARQFEQVPAQITRFVYAGGQKLPGLVNRRAAEVALWQQAPAPPTPELPAAEAPPSSVTRTVTTDPAPAAPKPMAKASLATKIVSVTAAVGAGASQVNDIVAPHSASVPLLAKIAAGLTMVIVACGVIALLIHKYQQQAAKS